MPATAAHSDSGAILEPKPLRPGGPYVGPKPFGTEDADRFFGRDRESQELAAMVQAHPIVVLYSQSGAGKTSLLNARLVPMLEARGAIVHSGVRVGQRVEGADAATNVFAYNALTHLRGQKPDAAETFADFVARTPALRPDGRPARLRVIILDQFEEMFTLLPEHWQQRREFFRQVGATLDTDDLRERAGRLRRLIAWCDRRARRLEERGRSADRTRGLRASLASAASAAAHDIDQADSLRYVIALREEFIAELDPLACHVPERLGARYRLERLRETQALEAIVKPLEGTGVRYAPGAAELLVANLRRGGGVNPIGTTDASDEFVEPVHLQVVCESLWRNFGQTQGTITESDVRSCGNIDEALTGYFEQSIAQVVRKPEWDLPQLRCWFANELIREGRRVLVMQAGQRVAGLPQDLANQLAALQLLRAVPRAGVTYFEITHDRFVRPILHAHAAWREEMHAKHPSLAEWEARAHDWARRGGGAGGMLTPDALAAAEAWLASEEARTLTPSDELRHFVLSGRTARDAFETTRPDIAQAEERARQWEGRSRPVDLLLARDQLSAVEEWTASPEAERVGYSPALKALESSSRAALNELEQRRPELVRLEGRARQWAKSGRQETELLTLDQLAEAEGLFADIDIMRFGVSAQAVELVSASRIARDRIEHEKPIVRVWEQQAAAWRAAGRPTDALARGEDLEDVSEWLAQPVSRGLGASRALVEWGSTSQRRQEEIRARHPGAAFLAKRSEEWAKRGKSIGALIPFSQVRSAVAWIESDDAKELGVSDLTREYVVASRTWSKMAAGFGGFFLLCVVAAIWSGWWMYTNKAAQARLETESRMQAELAAVAAKKAESEAQQRAETGRRLTGLITRTSRDRAARAQAILDSEGGNKFEALAAALQSVADPVLEGQAPQESIDLLRRAYGAASGPTPLRELGGEEPKSVHVSGKGLYAMVVCPRGLYVHDAKTGKRLGEPIRPSAPDSLWVDGHFTPDDNVMIAVEAPLEERESYAANAQMVQKGGPRGRAGPSPARIRLIPVGVVTGTEKETLRPFEAETRSAQDIGSTDDVKVCFALVKGRITVWPDWPSERSFTLTPEGPERGRPFLDGATRISISGSRERIVTACASRGVELWDFSGTRIAQLPFPDERPNAAMPVLLWSPGADFLVGVLPPSSDRASPGRAIVWNAADGRATQRFTIDQPAAEYVSLIDGGKSMIVIGAAADDTKQARAIPLRDPSRPTPPVTLGVADLLGVRVLMDGRAIVFGAKRGEGGVPRAYSEIVSTDGGAELILVKPNHEGYCSDADTDGNLRRAMCIRQDENGDRGAVFLWDRQSRAPDPGDLSTFQLIEAACRVIQTQPESRQIPEIMKAVLGEGQG